MTERAERSVFPSGGRDATPVSARADVAHGQKVRRFHELEGLRGIAALLVVFYHLPYWHPSIHAFPLVENGSMMVQLFFILSGFVIAAAYRNRLTGLEALREFQFLRFGRLYPVHLVFLGFFLLMELLKLYLATRYDIHSNNTLPFKENNGIALVEQLFLLHPLLGNALTFNTPAWSIGIEFYIYLVFGLLVVYVPKYFTVVAAVLSATSIAALALIDLEGSVWLWVSRGLSGFFLGTLVHHVAVQRPGPAIPYLMPLSMIAMLGYLFTDLSDTARLLIYPITAVMIYAIATGPDGLCRRVLRSGPLALLGRVSYSVYMCHAAMIWTMSQVVRFVLTMPGEMSPRGHVDAVMSFGAAMASCAVVVVATLGVGFLVCKYVEEPMRLLSRRWAGAHL